MNFHLVYSKLDPKVRRANSNVDQNNWKDNGFFEELNERKEKNDTRIDLNSSESINVICSANSLILKWTNDSKPGYNDWRKKKKNKIENSVLIQCKRKNINLWESCCWFGTRVKYFCRCISGSIIQLRISCHLWTKKRKKERKKMVR